MKAAKRNQFGLAALLVAIAVLSAVFALVSVISAVPLIGLAIVNSLVWLTLYAAPTMLVDYFARRGDSPERRG